MEMEVPLLNPTPAAVATSFNSFINGEGRSSEDANNNNNHNNSGGGNNKIIEEGTHAAAGGTEPEPTPTHTHGHSLKSVYLDQQAGTWKCQHCTWTYPIGSRAFHHLERMNSKTITKQQPILDLGNKGAASKNGTVGKEIMQSEPSDSPPSSSNSTKILTIGITNRQSIINSKEEGQSVHLSLPEKSVGNGSSVLLDKNDYISEVKGKQDFVEWDVERVLEEQETHDLFCPKCKSCITKRVVLRKRKRRGQDAGDDPRPSKIEILDQSSEPTIDEGSITDEHPLDDNVPLNTNGQDRDAGPFIFRCLSCFSFFIPAVAGWKVFRSSRKESEDTNVQDTQQRETAYVLSEQEGAANRPSDIAPATVQMRGEDVPVKSKRAGENNWFSAGLVPGLIGAGQKVEGAVEKKSPGMEQNLLAADGNDEPILHRSKDDNLTYGTNSITLSASVQFPEDSYIGKLVDSQNLAEKPLQPGETLISIEKNLGDSQGVGITVVVDNGQSARDVINDTFTSETRPLEEERTELNLGEHAVNGTRRIHNLEIVKCIVYGGLIESITSLGVVSSAAGGDASTLNILALGLANLVAGLPIIAHSLDELKKEHDRGNQSNGIDRYHLVLGQRRNFWIHAVVAVISFLVCGIVPIVTYGFSFRKSDNKEYKLIAVAAASLFCVVLLSIGKAYVEKPPKPYVKTMVKFVMAGVMASGLSFAVGVLVKGVLEKLGLFEPSVAAPPPPSMSFFEVTSRNPAWASY